MSKQLIPFIFFCFYNTVLNLRLYFRLLLRYDTLTFCPLILNLLSTNDSFVCACVYVSIWSYCRPTVIGLPKDLHTKRRATVVRSGGQSVGIKVWHEQEGRCGTALILIKGLVYIQTYTRTHSYIYSRDFVYKAAKIKEANQNTWGQKHETVSVGGVGHLKVQAVRYIESFSITNFLFISRFKSVMEQTLKVKMISNASYRTEIKHRRAFPAKYFHTYVHMYMFPCT